MIRQSVRHLNKHGAALRIADNPLRTVLFGAVVGVTAVLLWPVFAHAAEVWSTQEEVSFGLLLPPLAAGLVWWRRDELRKSISSGARYGLPVVVLALTALVLFERLAARSPAAIAGGVLLWGMVVYLWGWSAGRVLAFPIALLTIGLALQQTLLSSIAFPLQQITAAAAADLANGLGLSITQDGLILRSNAFAFEVAEACSGMNSLLALLTLAAVWIHLGGGSMRSQAGVLVSVLPIVVVANTVRVVTVLEFAAEFGQDAAVGFFHSVSGLLLFGVAMCAVAAFGWLLEQRCLWRIHART